MKQWAEGNSPAAEGEWSRVLHPSFYRKTKFPAYLTPLRRKKELIQMLSDYYQRIQTNIIMHRRMPLEQCCWKQSLWGRMCIDTVKAMFGSDSKMVKIIFVIFKMILKHIFNHPKSIFMIPCEDKFEWLNACFELTFEHEKSEFNNFKFIFKHALIKRCKRECCV